MTNSKRIVCFVSNDLVYDQRMQRICGALGEAGHDVRLVGRRKRSSPNVKFDHFDTQRFNCFFNRGALFYAELNVRIFFYILFNKMDVAVAVDLDTILSVVLAGRLRKLAIVFDAHEWFTEIPELIGRPRVKNIWRRIEQYCIPKTTLRYTVNQSLADIFEKTFTLSFEVIRNVPVGTAESKGVKASENTILYQGALNKGRGIEASIRAMALLDDYHLWIVGEGDLSQDLRQLSTDLKLDGRVHFLGYKKPAALKLITQQVHVGLNLLEGESKNYYYSLANKFFDYMHAGIPSINMKFPEYENILNKFPCGQMIAACNPESIAESVRAICAHEDQYNKMVTTAKLASTKYRWELEKLKLVELYNAF